MRDTWRVVYEGDFIIYRGRVWTFPGMIKKDKSHGLMAGGFYLFLYVHVLENGSLSEN